VEAPDIDWTYVSADVLDASVSMTLKTANDRNPPDRIDMEET
jgi:hypothetical protein